MKVLPFRSRWALSGWFASCCQKIFPRTSRWVTRFCSTTSTRWPGSTTASLGAARPVRVQSGLPSRPNAVTVPTWGWTISV